MGCGDGTAGAHLAAAGTGGFRARGELCLLWPAGKRKEEKRKEKKGKGGEKVWLL